MMKVMIIIYHVYGIVNSVVFALSFDTQLVFRSLSVTKFDYSLLLILAM